MFIKKDYGKRADEIRYLPIYQDETNSNENLFYRTHPIHKKILVLVFDFLK